MAGVKNIGGLAACLLLCIAGVRGLGLPSYLEACPKNLPNFNECATKNGKKAIPTLVKGDRKYEIPPLDPLVIKEMKIFGGRSGGPAGIELTMQDVQILGLKDTDLTLAGIDFDTRKVVFEMKVPVIQMLNHYIVDGRVLVLPIKGDGPSNITLENVDLKYTFGYDLVDRKGVKHLDLKDSKLDYKTRQMYIKLENLFGGNKLLGDNMNTFLNENWRVIEKDVGPAITDAISQVMEVLLRNVAKKVPFDQIFPDN